MDETRIFAKLTALETLVEYLYFCEFAKATDPSAAARNAGELVREEIARVQQKTGEEQTGLFVENEMNAFFDRIARKLDKHRPR